MIFFNNDFVFFTWRGRKQKKVEDQIYVSSSPEIICGCESCKGKEEDEKTGFSSEEDEKADVTVLSLSYKVSRVCRSCKTCQHDFVVYKYECVGGEEENHYFCHSCCYTKNICQYTCIKCTGAHHIIKISTMYSKYVSDDETFLMVN